MALRWLGKNGERREFSYAELAALSNRFANLLERLGIGKGTGFAPGRAHSRTVHDRPGNAWKAGAVFCPLFSAFGPEPVRVRLAKSRARLLVTTSLLYQRKVQATTRRFAGSGAQIFTQRWRRREPGLIPFIPCWNAESDQFALPHRTPEDWALLHFTSGTTGTPKGAVHVHDAVVAHRLTGRLGIGSAAR
jgi:acetyl-CoA synthetase